MMRGRICNGVGIGWASCCCGAACTTRGATGRARTASGSIASNGRTPPERAVVDDYLLAIDHTETRLLELDARLAEIADRDPYREPVGWLRCFRGIDTLTAMLILAELHDFRRFASAPALMAYLGLVPGEDSSGEKHRRGRITRTGNALVRRLLVETAWHYQHRPSVGVALTAEPSRVCRRAVGVSSTYRGSFD
jgi:transposase